MLLLILTLKFFGFSYAASVNPILSEISQSKYFNTETTINQIINSKICDIVQIKLSSVPLISISAEDSMTLLCSSNGITKKNTFLNLEFRNDRLNMINLIIPMNKKTLETLIEKNTDWISQPFPFKIKRDRKLYTIYNSSFANLNYLEKL